MHLGGELGDMGGSCGKSGLEVQAVGLRGL